ncbi:hypothetical protein V499_08154 [Pseudogymnoascus sp. VKM F-103]|nr:hypothetical protein V499_08154 [Pseudogymnoascus sp. VKM F-103]
MMDPAVKTPDLKVQEPIHLSTIYESQTEDAFKPASTASKVPEAPTGQTTTRESSISKTSSSAITPEAPAAEVQAKAQVEDETQAQAGQERSVPSLFSLAGKIIIVTGAARDIGLTMSESLIECGAIVHELDRLPSPSPEFDRLAASPQRNTNLPPHRRSRRPCARHSRHQHRRNTLQAPRPHRSSWDPARSSRSYLLCRDMQPGPGCKHHRRDVFRTGRRACHAPGSIALIASMSGTVANRGLPCAAYNASKAGVQQLGRSLAAEWGREGIRVNTISPGYVVTQMVEELFEKFPERRDGWAGENMLGRLGKPGDLGGAGVFLMAGCSGWMTGGDLRIDGGNTAW